MVVEGVLAEELVAAVLEAGFAPVLGPEEGGGVLRQCRNRHDGGRGSGGRGRAGGGSGGGGRGSAGEGEDGGGGGDELLGFEAGLVDLVEVFPTGGGEGGGEVGDVEGFGLEGGGEETDAEALQAAGSAFGFVFKTSDLLEPGLVVVVAIEPGDVEAVGVAFAFVFADFVFFAWVDVGVEVEDGGLDVVLEHPFDNGGGAGGAAGVEEDLVEAFWDGDGAVLFHVGGFEGKGRKKKGKCKGGKEKMCNFAGKRRDMAGKPPCAGVGMMEEMGIWRVNRHAQVWGWWERGGYGR